MRISRAAGGVAAIAVGAVLAACTASSTGSTSASTTSASSTTATTATPAAPSSTVSTTVTKTATPSPAAPSSPASSTARSSSAVGGRTTACENDQLVISAAPLGGASEHGGYVLRFRNTSSRTCSLHGYPGVDAVRTAGPAVHAERRVQGYMGGSQHGLPTVRVHPGRTASAVLEYSTIHQAGAGGSCPAAGRIAVTAANTTRSVVLDERVTICNLEIHPTVPGTSGEDN